jgi:hypothetical protein
MFAGTHSPTHPNVQVVGTKRRLDRPGVKKMFETLMGSPRGLNKAEVDTLIRRCMNSLHLFEAGLDFNRGRADGRGALSVPATAITPRTITLESTLEPYSAPLRLSDVWGVSVAGSCPPTS